jgi:hypothetical protein
MEQPILGIDIEAEFVAAAFMLDAKSPNIDLRILYFGRYY